MSGFFRRAHLLWILGLLACVGLLVPTTTVVAQDSPQFPNWGPGMSPPDQEGVDQAPGSSSTYGYGAAPNAAAPAPGVIAPIYAGGCQYDLRGSWLNQGTQSAPYRSYSQYVYVRQYRSWIYAQQDDGTAYYGQCIGSRINFDMYMGVQYIGRQTGTISGNYRYYPPIPLYGDSAQPYAAPAPGVAPIGGSALSASFNWTSWYGSGSETWYPTYSGYVGPPYPYQVPPPPFPPAPTPVPPTPIPTATPVPPTPTPIPPSTNAPRIDRVLPAQGLAGTEVILDGGGFAADDNLILFGPSLGLHRPDGTPANMVSRGGSSDGRTLRFTVPHSGPSGILCDDGGTCVGITATLPQPGSYEIRVMNAGGTSSAARFDLIGAPDAAPPQPSVSTSPEDTTAPTDMTSPPDTQPDEDTDSE